MTMQVNVTTRVNSQSIRREVHNGRDHLILPSYPAGQWLTKPGSELSSAPG